MKSFRDVIELWSTRDALAEEVGATPAQVSKWWQRDSIPSPWWVAICSTSLARTAGVTGEVLTLMAGGEAAKAAAMAATTRGIANEPVENANEVPAAG